MAAPKRRLGRQGAVASATLQLFVAMVVVVPLALEGSNRAVRLDSSTGQEAVRIRREVFEHSRSQADQPGAQWLSQQEQQPAGEQSGAHPVQQPDAVQVQQPSPDGEQEQRSDAAQQPDAVHTQPTSAAAAGAAPPAQAQPPSAAAAGATPPVQAQPPSAAAAGATPPVQAQPPSAAAAGATPPVQAQPPSAAAAGATPPVQAQPPSAAAAVAVAAPGAASAPPAGLTIAAPPAAGLAAPPPAAADTVGWFAPGAGAAAVVLTGFARQVPHFAPAPQLAPERVARPAPPVFVKTVTAHYLGEAFDSSSQSCAYRGGSLECHVARHLDAATADALWLHLPHVQRSAQLPARAFPGQALVAFSMEGAGYYPQVDNVKFLSHFDLTMTYHRGSDVPVLYPPFDIRASNESALPGFAARLPAVAFLNSNCSPRNRREEVVRALNASGVPVDSMGACQHNTKEAPGGKDANMRRYRACVAMENSNSRDYVTEKPWGALAAGCVPLYLGAPNAAADFFPAVDSAIWVDDYATPEELAAEVTRVLTDEAAWQRYMAWRARPWEQLSAGYRELVGVLRLPDTRCQLCQVLADRRLLREAAAAAAAPAAGGSGAGSGGASNGPAAAPAAS